ncbi:hypothetical protein R3P38DRAFT_3399312 [Favolaschia claudopus]|uniref:Transmembrane protein n=1 Tax=Favolaschia claudopus TaxID=2862362 RepID=A0AAW0AZL5_9AGAR
MSSNASTRMNNTPLPRSEIYSPYAQHHEQEKTHDAEDLGIENRPPKQHSPLLHFYRSISWILGFKDKYSLLNCFVWGGALVGFSLARSVAMNPKPKSIAAELVPGEWFWFQQPLYKINLFFHIYLTTFGGLCAVLQFFPAIRRVSYGVLFCLIVGNICGSIIGRRSFGGELNAQSGFYALGIMIAFSGLLGIYNVKRDTRRHRKWMLRMVVYFCAAITARIIMIIAREIITTIGTYYSIFRCDELIDLLTDAQAVQSAFPQCVAPGINPASFWVAVHASTHNGPLHLASAARATKGMALWIATLIHVVGVEYYIRATDAANGMRVGFVLEPLDYSESSTTSY